MSLYSRERRLCQVLDHIRLGDLTFVDVLLVALWIFFGLIRRVAVVIIDVLSSHLWSSFNRHFPGLATVVPKRSRRRRQALVPPPSVSSLGVPFLIPGLPYALVENRVLSSFMYNVSMFDLLKLSQVNHGWYELVSGTLEWQILQRVRVQP
jgi:hypothetical protein